MRTPLPLAGVVALVGCAAPPDTQTPTHASSVEARDAIATRDTIAGLPSGAFAASSQALEVLAMRVQVHAHNLANVQTAGFKRMRLQVADLPYDTVHSPGLGKDASGTASPAGLQLGAGARAVATIPVYTPGILEGSHRNLDLAIEGNGFFQVQMPDGTIGYTRDGQLMINADGRLVTAGGHVLQPEVQLAADVTEVNIDSEGRVTIRTQGNSTVQRIAQVQLAKFINPSGLLSCGGNILKETDSSGPSINGNPGANGLGGLKQGFIERSNVDADHELLLLQRAQRDYDRMWRLLSRSAEAGLAEPWHARSGR